MEYESFEEGLRRLASHDTGNEAMYGLLEVGLTTVDGQQRPYINVANHQLRLSDAEAATTNHIVVDCEKFMHHGGKISMRLEFIKNGDEWTIEKFEPVEHSPVKQPEMLWPKDGASPTEDVNLPLDMWRVSKLEVLKDKNSVGTLLNGERAYCGTTGIANVAYLHQSARQ